MTKITTANSAVTQLATDVFAPAAFDSLFWRPRYLIDSPVVSHLPLLFWVCAALRPSNAAVVGAGDGVAHFALCQAIDKFNGQGRCSGYGFWNDTASGGTAVTIPPKLMSHQEMLYEEISHLIPSQDPDAVADGLGEGALDLLWLDLAATPGRLGQRADLFSRALNRTGVMFIHGIRAISDEGADSAALKRLIKSKRCVRFDDEKGLLLVAFDGDVPTRIEALLTTAENAALAPEVERVFRRVGQGLVSSVRAADAVVAKKNAEKKAANLSAARDSAEGALKEINSAYELKNKKYAEFQSELFDARVVVAELKAQIAQIQGDHNSFQAAQAQTSLEAEQQLEAVRAEAGELRDQLKVAEEDRVALETAHQAALIEAEQQLEAVRAEAGELRDQLKVAEEDRVALETAHQAALADAEKLKASFEQTLNSERATRFSETTSLTRMAEDLRLEVATLSSHNTDLTTNLNAAETSLKLIETKLKTEISNEKRVRFKETAALTRMIEALKAEDKRKKRPIEVFLIKQLVRSDKKLNKYHRDRTAFFSDSSSLVARFYFRMRPGF